MKTKITTLAFLIFFVQFSCTSPKYIHDQSSLERQKDLRSNRSGNIIGDVLISLGAIVASTAIDADVGFMTSDREFKNFKLINTTTDTMFVNMLTDANWDNENYCDFMDIRIPPKEKCKILVPIGVFYNIYFGTSLNPENDEFVEINTSDVHKIDLTPGMTMIFKEAE